MKTVLTIGERCYIIGFAGCDGEMAEWLKALVLKTSDVERHRGFESLSLRQLCLSRIAGDNHISRCTQVAQGAPLLRE